jgi:hypothetical protein
MKRLSLVVVSFVGFATAALADDVKPLTVEQCITVFNGLSSLSWAGQQLNEETSRRPADAKQYKLGEARFTISMDIAALSTVITAYQRAQRAAFDELPALPSVDQNKQIPPEVQQMKMDNDRRIAKIQNDMMTRKCDVTPGRLKLSELKLGDGPDQNAIPPNVLAAFSFIIDADK